MTVSFSASSRQAVRGKQYETRCCPDCLLHSCECPQQQQEAPSTSAGYAGYGAGYGGYDSSAYGGYSAGYGGYGGAYGGYRGYGASAYGDYGAPAYGTKAPSEPTNQQPTYSEPTVDSSTASNVPMVHEQSPELDSHALDMRARVVEAEVEVERLYEVLEEAQLNIQMRTEQIRQMAELREVERQAASSALDSSAQWSIPLESTQQWQAINGALDELETARVPVNGSSSCY